MKYRIQESQYHGRACRGAKKTSSIQVIEVLGSKSYLIKKIFRFKVNDIESRKKAVAKAEGWMKNEKESESSTAR